MDQQTDCDLVRNVFTTEYTLNSPYIYLDGGEVNPKFIEYCESKGYYL